jgi:hypothetical protein
MQLIVTQKTWPRKSYRKEISHKKKKQLARIECCAKRFACLASLKQTFQGHQNNGNLGLNE